MTTDKAKELILYGKAPPDMVVEGSMDLGWSTYLKSLPSNLKVEGDLDLMGCTSLKSLPKNLTAEGWLDLSGCTSLKALPSNLRAGYWLDIRGCNSLKSLPKNLKVEGWLDLEGCTSLILPQGIPEGVKGPVYVDKKVLRNNKEYLLTMTNVNFSLLSIDLYKRILAE